MKNRKFVTISARRRKLQFNKMVKTSLLQGNSYICDHIPETKTMTEASLFTMVNRYRMVYIKPNSGSLGRGVIKITKNGQRYTAHIGRSIKQYTSYSLLYKAMKARAKGETYVVQRGIHSLRYNGKVIDFRVVVQRSPYGGFEVTGIAGRISEAGRVVSNGGTGGGIGSIDRLLTSRQCNIVVPKMNHLCMEIMKKVSSRWPHQHEIGVDIAIDYDLKPWILEYNTRPDHRMFVVMGDRRAVARIVKYGAHYGRKYRLYR